MTEEDLFKFDVRVRERLQRRGLVSDTELKRLVDGLPDLSERAVTMDARQPALGRGDLGRADLGRADLGRADGARADGTATGAGSIAGRAQPPVPLAPQAPVPAAPAKPPVTDGANEGGSHVAASESRPTPPKSVPPQVPAPEAPAPEATDATPQRLSFGESAPATVPTGEAPALQISESASDEEEDVDSSWGTDS